MITIAIVSHNNRLYRSFNELPPLTKKVETPIVFSPNLSEQGRHYV